MGKRIKHENESETIERAIEEEEFGIATTDQKNIGNDLGLHIAEAAHEASMLRETLSTLRQTFHETRREASVATMTNWAYKKQLRISRECFASTVKRDKLKNASQDDLELIQEGNDYFHGGNCVLDISIWELKGYRKDLDTFQYLYGLNPPQVERILLSPETVDALDDHTTIIASKFHAPTEEFHVIFLLFVQELITADFPCSFLSEPNNRVTKLYWEFREAVNRVPRVSNPK